MKKTYISPLMRTINIEAESMLAGSQDPSSMSVNETEGEIRGGMSNRRNIWGEEY